MSSPGPDGRMNSGRSHDDGKVTSLADARRRKRAEAKAARAAARSKTQAARGPVRRDNGQATVGGWIFGAAMMAMAVGMIAWWLLPMFGVAGPKQ
ncbi:MAG: hypothetical protein AB7O43_06270 [Hyphomicrobiaceae bacterium]